MIINAAMPPLGRLALVHEAHSGELAAAFLRAHLDPLADTTMRGERAPGDARGYRIDNGVAIVPLRGSLITDGPFVGSAWGVTSYEGFRAEMRRAASDPKVSAIVLAVNSPGGMVAGIEGAAQTITDAKAKKPVVAMVEGFAASAAYWLASQADEIVLSPLSEVGSIGVVGMHADYSGAFEKAGIKVTLISSGEHKVDGNPYGPLDAESLVDWQSDVDRLRGEFAAAVGCGRGARFDAAKALATEARMFPASKAIAAGLADRIGSLDTVISTLSATATSRSTHAQKGKSMSDNSNGPAFAQADIDRARAEGLAAGQKEASVTAAAAERARIAGILDSDEAKGREALARKLAFTTAQTPDEAKAFLADLPKAEAAATAPSIADRAADTATLRRVEGQSGATAAAPKQAGAISSDDLVAKINAESARSRGVR